MKFVFRLSLAVALALALRAASDGSPLPALPATYVGPPRAAGEAGQLRIIVSPNGSFFESAPAYTLIGTWTYDADASIFELTGAGKTAYFALSPHGDLIALDAHAKRIPGGETVYVREEPVVRRTLESATWSLAEIDGRAVTGETDRETPSLRFDGPESRVTGSTGCNRLTGGYKYDEGMLHFTPLATTRMLCADSIVNEAAAFLAALASVTRYEISGDTLTLDDGEKPVLVFRAVLEPKEQPLPTPSP